MILGDSNTQNIDFGKKYAAYMAMDAKKPPEGGFLMYILPLSNGDFIQKRGSIWERLNRRFYEAVMAV